MAVFMTLSGREFRCVEGRCGNVWKCSVFLFRCDTLGVDVTMGVSSWLTVEQTVGDDTEQLLR